MLPVTRFIELIKKYGEQAITETINTTGNSGTVMGEYRLYMSDDRVHVYLVPLPTWDTRDSIKNIENVFDIQWDAQNNIVGEDVQDAVFLKTVIQSCLDLEANRFGLINILNEF